MVTKQNKKYFFGWTNIKFGITEIIKMFSEGKSFFSKKRIESSIAFTIAQFGMVWYLIKHIDTMSTEEIVFWAATEFTIAGYMVYHIQKQKKNEIAGQTTISDENNNNVNSL